MSKKKQHGRNQSREKARPVAIRREKSGRIWRVADKDRKYFEYSQDFGFGILSKVTFVHSAPPMQCVSGYDSTGEAIGVLSVGVSKMPADAVRILSVAYDPKNRLFHEVGNPANKIDSADYLLLKEYGAAIAGWKTA